jgi:uncharacterized protein YidB (DUF937 family)
MRFGEGQQMGRLEQIIGELPLGRRPPPVDATKGLLANGRSGGLNGLKGSFVSAGLGHIFQSRVGNGPNQSIAPHDIHRD